MRHSVTAEVVASDAYTQGVIIAQAGYFGLERTNVAATTALGPGKHMITYEFIPDQAKPGTGGRSIFSINGQQAAEDRVPKTQPFIFSGDEDTDVGRGCEGRRPRIGVLYTPILFGTRCVGNLYTRVRFAACVSTQSPENTEQNSLAWFVLEIPNVLMRLISVVGEDSCFVAR